MKLKIKFLKPFSKIIGKNELKLDFNGITFEDLLNVLVDKYPKLVDFLRKKVEEQAINSWILVSSSMAAS